MRSLPGSRRLVVILRYRGILGEQTSTGSSTFHLRRCSSTSSSVGKLPDFRLGYVSRELEGLSSLKPSSGGGERRREESGAKEAVASHRWPEWMELMETLRKDGSLDRSDFEKGYAALSEFSNRVRTACLDYARDRSELIRYLSREDIHVIVGSGCPSLDRKVVNSGKRLRAYVGIDEGKVCSSCVLRRSCERAFLNPREEERGRTADVMRILLTFALELAAGSSEIHPPLNKPLEESARRILRVMVDFKSPPTTFTGKVNAPLKQGDWICPKCDFVNFAKNVKCLRCNDVSEEKIKKFKEEFQHLPLKKGDWICRTCNFLNFAKNTRCLQCQEKPAGRQLNPGEWECSSCNYINFRKNEYCLKCSWKRPKAAAAVAAEEQKGISTEHLHFSRISFVRDEPPALTVPPSFVQEAKETPPMGSMLTELDGSDDEDDMVGWFGPPREKPIMRFREDGNRNANRKDIISRKN